MQEKEKRRRVELIQSLYDLHVNKSEDFII